jgi:hypothetical protein
MSGVTQINDGNWNVAQQDGPWRYSFPFANRGDDQTFDAIRTMKQSALTYNGPTGQMQSVGTARGTAYMIEASPTRYDDCGVLEWDETFCSVPVKRVEPGSIAYAFQFIYTPVNYNAAAANGVIPLPDPPQLGDITKTVPCNITYTYSLSTFAPIDAPRVVVLFDRFIYYFGGWGKLIAGQTILAEDATSSIYRGKIYEQKKIQITIPTSTQQQ